MLVRIILAIVTALIFVAMLVFGVMGLVIHQPILTVTCAMLAFVFGFFMVHDYNFFFGKKSGTQK